MLLNSSQLIATYPSAPLYGATALEIDNLLLMAEEDFFPPALWGGRATRMIAFFALHSLELQQQLKDTGGGAVKSISLEDENSEVVFNQIQSGDWIQDLDRTYYGKLLKSMIATSRKRVFSVGSFSKCPIPSDRSSLSVYGVLGDLGW